MREWNAQVPPENMPPALAGQPEIWWAPGRGPSAGGDGDVTMGDLPMPVVPRGANQRQRQEIVRASTSTQVNAEAGPSRPQRPPTRSAAERQRMEADLEVAMQLAAEGADLDGMAPQDYSGISPPDDQISLGED